MTGGRVVILGPTGRNFAAGMSGGIAYVWDVDRDFLSKCNLGMVELERIETNDDIAELMKMVRQHAALTQSTVAQQVLNDWPEVLEDFVKVMPLDYKRVLTLRKQHDEEIETPLRGVPTSG
jgi:glutamate synthase (NADPH/NADH) large chain